MRSISACEVALSSHCPIRERPRREAAAPSRAPMKLDVTFDVPLDKGVGGLPQLDQRSNWHCLLRLAGRLLVRCWVPAGEPPRVSWSPPAGIGEVKGWVGSEGEFRRLTSHAG